MERTFEYFAKPMDYDSVNEYYEHIKNNIDFFIFLEEQLSYRLGALLIKKDYFQEDERNHMITVDDNTAQKLLHFKSDEKHIDKDQNELLEFLEAEGSFFHLIEDGDDMMEYVELFRKGE